MGILEKAYRTYDGLAHLVGVIEEGKTPLPPISHIIANAQIEITIDMSGNFHTASVTTEETKKTIIPVTESSAGRSSGVAAHALSDNLSYLLPNNEQRYTTFMEQLQQWTSSEHSHCKAEAVLVYMKKGELLQNLIDTEIVKVNESGGFLKEKILGTEYEKCVVRWVVLGGDEKYQDACYKDISLFQAYISYYNTVLQQNPVALCVIKGEKLPIATNHPKGIVSASYGAKLLVSSDDNKGYVSYEVSQKAHNLLRYLIVNYGEFIGEMSFVWWNVENKNLPKLDQFDAFDEDEEDDASPQHTIKDYKERIRDTFSGYKNEFLVTDDVVIATFEAATTGRLSLTYYNEFKANDFFERIEKWYMSIAFIQGKKVVPKLKEIVRYAYGVDSGKYIEVHNKKILSEQMKSLLNCLVGGAAIPSNIVRALVVNASAPQRYQPGNYARVLYTACAVLRKYYNDKYQKEVYGMGLDLENKNRSYLFGRLLAICDKVEKSTYDFNESRETNAVRIQSTFANRPMTSFRVLENQLAPYYGKLKGGLAVYFKNMITEIFEDIDINDASLNKPLEDIYLLGYYHQRAILNRKKEVTTMKVNEEETDDAE
ncbi:MAG: type I-C CRISPR-associated protein Cas8c/Csd1 [Bacillota bacterium]